MGGKSFTSDGVESAVGGSGPGFDTSSLGTYGGAASQAIATTGQLISQAALAQSQRDFSAGQNDQDRATRAQLAKMQLNESKFESNQSAKANAYKMLMAAFSGQMANENATFSNKRNANSAMDQILSSAMLRR